MTGLSLLGLEAYDLPNAHMEASSSNMKSDEKTRLVYFSASRAASALGV